MGADILERLNAKTIPGNWTEFCRSELALRAEAAAEIGRLRGELDSLRGWFDASRAPSNMSDDHDDAAGDDADDIAPAEAKGDAYGVFCTMDDGRVLRITGYIGDTEIEVLGHVLARAKREGFTGTAQERMAELGWRVEPMFRRTPQPVGGEAVADVVLHDGLLYGRLRGDLPVGTKLYTTPAAVPAGEAVAVYEGNPCVECGEDTGTGHFPGCCLGTTPQPADGEAVAPLGYVRRDAIRKLREDDEVTGVMVHAEAPTDSVPVYTTPPAPVQAAPPAAPERAHRPSAEWYRHRIAECLDVEEPMAGPPAAQVQKVVQAAIVEIRCVKCGEPTCVWQDESAPCVSCGTENNAPVQAAPQEGEAYQPVRFGGIRRPSDEALAAAFWEHRQRENSLPADLCDSKLVKFGNDIVQRARELAPYLAAHHSACELGAVREAAELARKLLEAGMLTHNGISRITVHATRAKAVLTRLTEALQHRGDSRGGEG